MVTPKSRTALWTAEFFLRKDDEGDAEHREEFKAYLEASIVFARSELHRFQTKHSRSPGWKTWWNGLLSNQAVNFFRDQRNRILKEGPSKVGQVVHVGQAPDLAKKAFSDFLEEIEATSQAE